MKQHWHAFRKAAWDTRLPRERQFIGAAALILVPALAYFALWRPAHLAVPALRAALPIMRAQAAEMKRQSEEIELLRRRPQPAVLDSGALKNVVEHSAAQHGLRDALDHLDGVEPSSVRITFASVSYAQWLRWVRILEQEQHIRIDSLEVMALTAPGMVRITAILTNGPSG